MSAKIKICGITNEEDALWVVNLGGDYLGFNFYKQSPRHVSVQKAAQIVQKLPPFITTVGVFVDHSVDEIIKIVQKTGIKGVQLHGQTSLEECQQLKEKCDDKNFIIKVFRIAEESDFDRMGEYVGVCDYFLLDTKMDDQMGGTGKTFPWELVQKAKSYEVPTFLAGGLTPENVKKAVADTQPFAVDVASGVERLPKRKDYNKLKMFIEEVKSA